MHTTRLLMAALALATTASAQAQDTRRDLAGGLHLALEGSLLGYGRASAQLEEDEADAETGVFTVGFPIEIAARIGYLPLDRLEVGARFTFSYARAATEEGSTTDKYSNGNHELAAYARYVAPTSGPRPFAGIRLGGAFDRDRDPGEDGDPDVENRARAFVVGGELGLLGFIAEHFSLDPFVAFTYRTGSITLDRPFFEQEIDLSSWDLTLNLALSGWLFPGR